MKTLRLWTFLCLWLLIGGSFAQVQNDGLGNYWLNNTGPAPRSFLIGNAVMPFPFESILDVRGDWMTNLTLGLRGGFHFTARAQLQHQIDQRPVGTVELGVVGEVGDAHGFVQSPDRG